MLKYVTDIKKGIYLKQDNINSKLITKKLKDIITINLDDVITDYDGMGGAITESVAFNYSLLSTENKLNFINDCFSKNGLNYNYMRISIGSCDFSLRSSSYAKKKDLSDFNIDHDQKYLIPLIKEIIKNKKINIIASPWSPPRMYKRFKLLRFGTKLRKKYYDSYSTYLIKYIDSYQEEGINITYLTMQNEPMARQKWESCRFSLIEQKEFIYQNLLPKLKNTKLLLFDHNKDNLYNTIKYLYLKNNKISGIAFHNYSGSHFNELKKIHQEYKELLLINTEGCTGFSKYDEISWIKDAEYYLNDLIGDFNNGTNAYLDWNILLNQDGGPSHIKNPVKSALVLSRDNYFKTPIYYYLYHVSHFIDSKMQVISNTSSMNVLSFKDAQKVVVIIMNKSNSMYRYNLVIDKEYISDSINAHSIITYVYQIKKKTRNNKKNII